MSRKTKYAKAVQVVRISRIYQGNRVGGLLFLSLFFLLFFLPGCGPKKKSEVASDHEFMFYPPLPNEPKFQYLTTLSSASDLETNKKSQFRKFVLGKDEEKPVAIHKPYGVDIYDGVVYVGDMKAGAVATLDMKSGEFGFIGLRGTGKLSRPINLKLDRENELLYVADFAQKQVKCFTLKGKFIRAYGKAGQFEGPTDVDIHGERLFVCDVKKHQIHVLNRKTGESLFLIGKAGGKPGELFHPTNICVRGERLYVSETNNFRVQIFDLDGNHISVFGNVGATPGSFSRNKGIAVDKDGRILVVDAAFENVQVFDKDFKLLLFMLGPGSDVDSINLPAGIAIDYDNIQWFRKYLAPGFQPEYLMLVTSHFGNNKVNIYAYGHYLD